MRYTTMLLPTTVKYSTSFSLSTYLIKGLALREELHLRERQRKR